MDREFLLVVVFVLLEQILIYAEALKANGYLIMSGFLTGDKETIKAAAAEHGLNFASEREEGNWVAARFIKN